MVSNTEFLIDFRRMYLSAARSVVQSRPTFTFGELCRCLKSQSEGPQTYKTFTWLPYLDTILVSLRSSTVTLPTPLI